MLRIVIAAGLAIAEDAVAREVVRDAADAEPARVHARAADRLDDVENFLAVVEHEEGRGHRAEVLREFFRSKGARVPDRRRPDREGL